MPLAPYTLEQAEQDIADLRGQLDILNEAHIVQDAGVVPNVVGTSGFTTFSSGGHMKYMGADGQPYNTGRATVVITANQTINSASNQIVGANSVPMSWQVGIGSYLVVGMVNWTQGSNTQAQNNGFSGPSTSSARIANNWMIATLFATNGPNTRESGSLGAQTTPAYASGVVVEWHFTGVFTTSATGTFSVVATAPTTSNTYTIGAQSFASVFPVT